MSSFGKSIHNLKDGGVAIRQRETSDKVQEYIGAGAMRKREWLKEASQSLPQSLILSTHCARGDKCGDVRNHSGPPKTL